MISFVIRYQAERPEHKTKEKRMQYIVLDLEWNQPWPGSYSAKKVLPSPIRGEIVQIGAVRMPCEGTVADEFQTLIRPAYYKKMNRKVASLASPSARQCRRFTTGAAKTAPF